MRVVMVSGLHPKTDVWGSNMRFMHMYPVWVHPMRGNEHVSMCSAEIQSAVWLIPLELCSGHRNRIRMLGNRNWMVWRSRHFIIWRRSLVIVQIDGGYIMNASSSLVFPTRKLPNEVFLGMASHLSRRSSYHKITRNVSPIPFAVFFQAQEKQPVMIEDPCQNGATVEPKLSKLENFYQVITNQMLVACIFMPKNLPICQLTKRAQAGLKWSKTHVKMRKQRLS